MMDPGLYRGEVFPLFVCGALGALSGCCLRGRLTVARVYRDRSRLRIEPGFLGTAFAAGVLANLYPDADGRIAGCIGLAVALAGVAAVERIVPLAGAGKSPAGPGDGEGGKC